MNKFLEGISIKSKISLIIAGMIMLIFFAVQTCISFKVCPPSYELALFGYICILAFIPPFFIVVIEFLRKKEEVSVELSKKNAYLEHAAKIIRHDMHSGINTYIPRGLTSLQRRLNSESIENLKLAAPLRLLTDGLRHAQKVYAGVFEFTNLIKQGAILTKKECNTYDILKDYLDLTSYKDQVLLDQNLPILEINEPLFCTAIDNMIRNGLKYNDSQSKLVKIYLDGDYIIVEDNGRGMSQDDFNELSKPYVRKKDQKENGTGLGLNITTSIMDVHNFTLSVILIHSGEKHFFEAVTALEERIAWNPTSYIYDREELIKRASSNDYVGKISVKVAGAKKKYVVDFNKSDKPIGKGTKIKIKIK